MTSLLLAALALAVLAQGWMDVQRIGALEAEASDAVKIITKYRAWHIIRGR